MRIGVLGGGQLGLMLARAARPLDIECLFLDTRPDACARREGLLIHAPFDHDRSLRDLARACDVVTYEFENVPSPSAKRIIGLGTPVHPPVAALATTQDRVREKEAFQRADFGVAPWRAVDDPASLESAIADLGTPGVLKTRRGGYDGKGQARVTSPEIPADAKALVSSSPCIYERFIDFDRELSIIGARTQDGACAFYPLVQNTHYRGILHVSVAPAPGIDADLQRDAESHARRLLDAIDYVGTFAIEFFHAGGRLLANEMAPRVHNTGHWSIEGADTSQFENHIRAIAGMPLGHIDLIGHSAMVNIIGAVPDRLADVGRSDGVHIHLYGKDPRPGRKLGHVTLLADSPEERNALLDTVLAIVGDPILA